MALIWMDGFDHYDGNVSNLTAAGYITVSNVVFDSTRVRNGSYSLRGVNNGAGDFVKPLPGNYQTIGVGCACFSTYTGYQRPLIDFSTSAGSFNSGNMAIAVEANGAISARRQSYAGTLLGSSAPGIFTAGSWHHIEVYAGFSNTVGFVQVRFNGVEILNLTNIDNVYTGAEYTTSIMFSLRSQGGSGSPTGGIDDLYIWDTAGTQNNTFLGDRKVTTLNLTDNTAVSEWGYTGAASPVQCINGLNDGDSSYIYAGSSTPVTSEFDFANPDASIGLIAGAQVVSVARKIEAGTVVYEQNLISGSSSTTGTGHSIGDNYGYYSDIFEINPATGMPWTTSALSNARLRLRRTT